MEIYKDVVGFEQYLMISNLGNVYSKRTHKTLKLNTSKTGYKTLATKFDGRKSKAYCLRIHRLVAEAFIANPEGKPYVNHKDGDKTNNHVENLEWCTSSENTTHALETGLLKVRRGEECTGTVLNEKLVLEIRKLHVPKKFGKRKISRLLGISERLVASVLMRESWNHI